MLREWGPGTSYACELDTVGSGEGLLIARRQAVIPYLILNNTYNQLDL